MERCTKLTQRSFSNYITEVEEDFTYWISWDIPAGITSIPLSDRSRTFKPLISRTGDGNFVKSFPGNRRICNWGNWDRALSPISWSLFWPAKSSLTSSMDCSTTSGIVWSPELHKSNLLDALGSLEAWKDESKSLTKLISLISRVYMLGKLKIVCKLWFHTTKKHIFSHMNSSGS